MDEGLSLWSSMVLRKSQTCFSDRHTHLNSMYSKFCHVLNSWGSAREAFSFEDMKRCKIPIPPIDVQRAIVNIYKCANEAKQIAEEADRLSREVCSALLQHVINS